MQTSTTAPEVAKTILHQLGGNKFIVMTGAKNIVYGTNDQENDFICFKIMPNAKKITHIYIELTSMDLYNMQFLRCSTLKRDIIKEHCNIYDDMLQDIFTQETQLYTHF
jgi:hypothetical protein